MAEPKIPSPESLREGTKESSIELEPSEIRTVPEIKPVTVPAPPAVTIPTRAALVLEEPVIMQQKIERVLEEDLADLYRELNPAEQAKFRTTGEDTAKKIAALLQEVKVRVSEILSLIRIWLLSISGINRYFAEQEAKIKAEKILKLRQKK
jgi:hypothetical protein